MSDSPPNTRAETSHDRPALLPSDLSSVPQATTTQRADSAATAVGTSFVTRVLITIGLAIGVFSLVMLLWYAVQVLLIVFAGVLVAILLRGLARLLTDHTRLSPRASLTVVIASLVILIGVTGYIVAPRVIAQGQQLYVTLPKAYEQAKGWAAKYTVGRLGLKMLPGQVEPAGGHGDLASRVTGAASSTLSALLTIILVMFVGLYLAAEPELYIDGLTRLFLKQHRSHVRSILIALGRALAGWLVGQGIDMAFIGCLTAGGLWIIGVPLAFVLGLVAAIANFIPNFGPLISLAPAALLALTISPHKVLMVVILFVIVQSIEGYILQPIIQRRTVALPPALTILAQALLGLLLGPMGIVLATPLMAAALVLVKVLYVRDVLHDPIPVQDAPPLPR